MSLRKQRVLIEKVLSLHSLFILLFLFSACNGPSESDSVTCTYYLNHDRGATDEQKNQSKSDFEAQVQKSTSSSEKDVTCSSTTTWTEEGERSVAQVTITCYRVSDSSAIRPPAGNKPPPGRVSSGTIEKGKCSDE